MMFDRLQREKFWAIEYDEFVREVSFARPDEIIGFENALAAGRRLVARIGEGRMTEASITVREVLRLLLEADSHPRLGNEDWRVADRMEAEALEKADTAVPSPDDPPEFGRWLEILLSPNLRNPEREEIYAALHDYFEEAMESRGEQ